MQIQTGKGTISLLTLISIWSISLVVNLPGLAVSPILSDLDTIFPGTPQLEIQLLTILPNLFIIPFVLLSGRLAVSKDKTSILVVALLIYLISGLLYLVASTMVELIIISCLLGIGCGMVIPLAASILTDYFVGEYRMKQLGIKSGIANVSLVLATLVVGDLAHKNWHLPFIVYLLPIIPLLMSVFLRPKPSEVGNLVSAAASGDPNTTRGTPVSEGLRAETSGVANLGGHNVTVAHDLSLGGDDTAATATIAISTSEDNDITPAYTSAQGKLDRSKILCILGFYGFVTYAVIVVSYYLPFLMQHYKESTTTLGVITSVFFLSIMAPGFLLSYVVKLLKGRTLLVAIVLILSGLALMLISKQVAVIGVAVSLMGLGYGIIQPLMYDKAAQASSGNKSTLALAIVLSANYLFVTVAPFVVDLFKLITHSKSELFPFYLNFLMVALFLVVSLIYQKSFAFKMTTDLETASKTL